MFNDVSQYCSSPVDRLYAEEARKKRLERPDLKERRETEAGRYAAYREACAGLYAFGIDVQDKKGQVVPPTWKPDDTEVWEWFWQTINSGREQLLQGGIVSCVLPDPSFFEDTHIISDGSMREITMKRIDMRLERFNFQQIDALKPERGNVARLANRESTQNLFEYLEKAGTPVK